MLDEMGEASSTHGVHYSNRLATRPFSY